VTGGRPQVVITPDEDRARAAGFQLNDIAAALNTSLEGQTGGSLLEGSEELAVRVRLAQGERTNLNALSTTLLLPPNRNGSKSGELQGVPLNALAKISLEPATDLITRRDGKRLNTIQGWVLPYSLPGAALADFKNQLKESGYQLPTGYRFSMGGETEKRAEAQARMLSVMGPLLVLMVGTLVLAFNSFRMAAVIGSVAALSSGLALLSLWIFGYPMGFMAIMGTMGLIGLAINDSIVVLSALRANEQASRGEGEAIREVVVHGTRHILSTTLTTIGGFLPLILFGGSLWPPLATAVAGGMVGATLLALLYIPSVFVLIVRRDQRKLAKGLVLDGSVVST